MAYNGLQLPVVGVWNTQLSIPPNGFLKIQNFILPRPRQLLVGAVTRWPSVHVANVGQLIGEFTLFKIGSCPCFATN